MLMRIYNEEEIRNAISLNASLLTEIERAYTDLVTKEVQMPPVMRVDMEEQRGEMDVKTAYIPGDQQYALKVSTGICNKYKIGLPTTGGVTLMRTSMNRYVRYMLQD